MASLCVHCRWDEICTSHVLNWTDYRFTEAIFDPENHRPVAWMHAFHGQCIANLADSRSHL
jgi:hypothetical protein